VDRGAHQTVEELTMLNPAAPIIRLIATAVFAAAGPALADCYGISGPSAGERMRALQRNLDAAHADDCQTVKALMDCGISQANAVALVISRPSAEDSIAQIITKCALAARAAPERR
jgi:hypothetical protein